MAKNTVNMEGSCHDLILQTVSKHLSFIVEIVINSLFGAVLSFVLHIISNYSKLCKTLSKIAPLFSDGIFSDIRKPAKPWTTFQRELLGVGEQLRQNPYLPNPT